MDLYQIRYFLTVVETGSFSRGAERVLVTQPTLSAGIKKLEGELGVRLFDRGRRVTLTAEGSRFLDHARVIVAEMNAAKNEVQRGGNKGRLKIGALRSLPTERLAALARDFAAAHRDTALELIDGTPREIGARLADGRIDVAVTMLDAGASRETTQPLYRRRWSLAVARDSAWAGRGAIAIGELHRHPIVFRTHCEFDRQNRRAFASQGVRPRIVYRTDRDERALAMVAAGLGASVMPDDLTHPGVAHVALDKLGPPWTIGLVWREGDGRERLAAFRSFAASHTWQAEGPGAAATRRLEWAR